jgi:hypothetical protein
VSLSLPRVARLLLIVLAACCLFTPASLGAATPPDHSTGAPVGDDLYVVLDRGQPFQCEPTSSSLTFPECEIEARITITAAQAKVLGLKSRVLAHGTAKGPVTARIAGRREHNLYFLKIPAAIKRRIKARHIVTMKVVVIGSARWESPAVPAGESGTATPAEPRTATWPDPDPDDLNDRDTSWGQGSRYGCRPLAGGRMINGYEHFGQKCPK